MASSDYKKFNREIKGYVDVRYDVKQLSSNDYVYCYYYNVSGRTNNLTNTSYSNSFETIINRRDVTPDYAILKENYTNLDGTRILFNNYRNRDGFISNETPSSITTYDERNIIFEANLTGGIKGLTFYFRGNTIKNANVFLVKSPSNYDTYTIENNDKEVFFIDASQDNYTSIVIETTEWTDMNAPLWIENIDLGISYRYQGNELIEFEITEQVDKLVEETPSNELRLTIGDYEHLYDPLNPKGITKFLTEGSEFVPYIGIRTEDGSFEYEKMGTFYFDKIDYSDKEVTFTCYNLINKLNKVMIKDTNKSLDSSIFIHSHKLQSRLENYLNTCYNYDYNISIDNTETMTLSFLKYDSLNVLLQKMAMIDGIYFVDRDNNITIKNIDKTIKEQLTKNVLLKDIKYSNIDNKKGIKLLLKQAKSETKASEIVCEYELTKAEEEICITSDSMNLFGATATATNVDTINVISDNFFSIIFLKLTGTVGSKATITISTQAEYTTNEIELDYGEKNSNIAIDNNLYYIRFSNDYSTFIEKIPTYKVELEYNGNPTIKAGDYIEVESNYGKVPIFVQKHTLKYNGGLSGSIEGVE